MPTNSRPGIPAVTDDLKAIRNAIVTAVDEPESYAAALSSLPTVTSIMGRLQAHKFAALQCQEQVATSQKRDDLRVLAALLVLTASGRIALGVTPAMSVQDVWFKRAGENDLRKRISDSSAGGIPINAFHLSAYDLSDATGEAAVFSDDEVAIRDEATFRLRPNYVDRKTLPGTPAAYTLQEAASLLGFVKAAPALDTLIENALTDLARADQWAADATGNATPYSSVLLQASRYAAIRAYSAISTVQIWPANGSSAQAAKQRGRQIARFRATDPAKLRASVELAYDAGEGMTKLADLL